MWVRRSAGTSSYHSGSWVKCAIPGAASTLVLVTVLPSLIAASNRPSAYASDVTSTSSTSSAFCSRNHSVWSRKTAIGIGSCSSGPNPRSSKYAANECTPSASNDQSRPERRYMSGGIWSRQKLIGRPTMRVRIPFVLA